MAEFWDRNNEFLLAKSFVDSFYQRGLITMKEYKRIIKNLKDKYLPPVELLIGD